MCNLYRLEKAPDAIASLIRELGVAMTFPEGIPNFEPRDIRITDRAPVLRAAGDTIELVQKRWSWPGPGGKPVFNFRSEGRRFPAGSRCVIPADGFYEFTAPAEQGKKTKDRWLFTLPGHSWFGIAGILREDPDVGEAFSLLTCEPGPDIQPYHARQIVVLTPRDCLRWLDPATDTSELTRPLRSGSLAVQPA